MTSYTVQTRNGPNAKWKPLRFGRTTFAALDSAIKCAQGLDEDGCFNTRSRSLRIVNELGERVEFDRSNGKS